MKAYNIIKSILALSLAVIAVSSCQEKINGSGFVKGEAVKFSIGTDVADTKAVYSGDKNTAGTIERIDWQAGDMIRIYCAQASEPSTKYADYAVTSVEASGANSKAHIEGPGGVGLRWGEGTHTFYAVYPCPEEGTSITTGIDITPYDSKGLKSSVSKSISKNIVSADIPSQQRVIGSITESDGNWTADPDLMNMLMTAKASYSAETGIPKGSVFLNFTPLTTAIKFTIKNGTGAELNLTDVQLISGNGKTSAPIISGTFCVDLDQIGIASGTEIKPFDDSEFKITYNQKYPLCSTTSPESTSQKHYRTLTIPVGTDATPLKIAEGKTFTFTFFLNPTHDFRDLTFKLIKAGGSWMSTWLGYNDGNGIFFPRHKKTTVAGLLIPEGAQWYVKFDGDITAWGAGENGNLNFEYSEGEIAPVVTKWDTGIREEVKMDKITTP